MAQRFKVSNLVAGSGTVDDSLILGGSLILNSGTFPISFANGLFQLSNDGYVVTDGGITTDGEAMGSDGAGNFSALTVKSAGSYVVTQSQTGQFAPSVHTHAQYVNTGDTGSFITTGQTGQFAASVHTHSQYVDTGNTGNFITTSQTGSFVTTGDPRNLALGGFVGIRTTGALTVPLEVVGGNNPYAALKLSFTTQTLPGTWNQPMFLGQVPNNCVYLADVYRNTSMSDSWSPKNTFGNLITLQEGTIRFYANTGLTSDVGYTPTERLSIAPNGVISINGNPVFTGSTVEFATILTSGVDNQTINYPLTLASIPTVNCIMQNEQDDYIYGYDISNITTSGFKINFTSNLDTSGYLLNTVLNL